MPDHVDHVQTAWRRERPDIDVGPQGIIGRLHRLAARLTDELVAVYAEHGLTEGEFDLLCTLRRAGSPYARQPADLARSTMVTSGGTTKRVDRLEAGGLVQRIRPTHGDRRALLVQLTPAGVEVIDRAFEAHMANEARLVAQLPASDRSDLQRILRDWLAHHEAPEV